MYNVCCINIATENEPLKLCNKPAAHWYLHNDEVCSYCDEHDYQCGKILDAKQISQLYTLCPVCLNPAVAGHDGYCAKCWTEKAINS